jgi:hypothetical protein
MTKTLIPDNVPAGCFSGHLAKAGHESTRNFCSLLCVLPTVGMGWLRLCPRAVCIGVTVLRYHEPYGCTRGYCMQAGVLYKVCKAHPGRLGCSIVGSLLQPYTSRQSGGGGGILPCWAADSTNGQAPLGHWGGGVHAAIWVLTGLCLQRCPCVGGLLDRLQRPKLFVRGCDECWMHTI